jgi:uncharacterized protein YkwD
MAPTRTFRARRLVAVLATAACLVGLAPGPAQAARPLEEEFAVMVGDLRSTGGLSTMSLSDRLSKRARKHSRRMARAGSLFHSDLSRLLGAGVSSVGENVGYGSDLPGLLKAFVHSPAHLDNLLGKWNQTGVGIVRRGGRLWITQIFRS